MGTAASVHQLLDDKQHFGTAHEIMLYNYSRNESYCLKEALEISLKYDDTPAYCKLRSWNLKK
jgi:hypothetical protein